MGQVKFSYAKKEFADYFQYEDVLVEHFARRKLLYVVSKLWEEMDSNIFIYRRVICYCFDHTFALLNILHN